MKFRAVMNELAVMREFMTVAISLSKFAKDCVLRISKKKVYFIISEDTNGPKRPLAWCELPVSFYFKEFSLEGVSEHHNEIYLELSTTLLARSLSIIKHNVKTLKIKLTNKESPCLTLEMEMLTDNVQNCVHDIPVEVIAKKHWGDYAEPIFNEFHVSMCLPNLKTLKTVVERMKSMSHTLTVLATKNGRFSLQIKTGLVSISAHYTDLSVESFAGQLELIHGSDSETDESDERVRTTVDIKQFLMFLTGLQLNNFRTVCSIVHGKMLKLSIEQPGALNIQVFLTEVST